MKVIKVNIKAPKDLKMDMRPNPGIEPMVPMSGGPKLGGPTPTPKSGPVLGGPTPVPKESEAVRNLKAVNPGHTRTQGTYSQTVK